MRAVVIAVVVLAFAGVVVAADEKIDAKELIDKWEWASPVPNDFTLVFEFDEAGLARMREGVQSMEE